MTTSRRQRAVPWPIFSLLSACCAVALTIATNETRTGRLATTLSLIAVLVLLLAIWLGSRAAVGFALLPALASSLINVTSGAEAASTRAILLGCLWYIAIETGWETIEQNAAGLRRSSVHNRRINEMATVLFLAVSAAGVSLLLADQAPARSLLIQLLGVVFVVSGLGLAINHLSRLIASESDE